MRSSEFGGRLGDLSGDLHDSVMIGLKRESQPLPDSVPLDKVRALHSSQIFGLVRDVLRDQLDAWESQLHRLNDELKQTQTDKAKLEATAELEMPRLANLAHEERARAEWLARERSRLEETIERMQANLLAREADLAKEKLLRTRKRNARLGELEQAMTELEMNQPADLQHRLGEVQLSCKRARVASRRASQRNMSLECELEALRGALQEHEQKSSMLAESNATLRANLKAHVNHAQGLELQLETAQRAFQDVWALSGKQEDRMQALLAELETAQNAVAWAAALEAELSEHRDAIDAETERRQALDEERELVNAALAATDSAMNALQRELKAARKVQRLSHKLGTLTAPGGADELREDRPDFALFAELQAAQHALKESWLSLGEVQDDLHGIRSAVQGRVEDSPWLKKELARLKHDLKGSRESAEDLEKERWATQATLEEREALLTVLEDDLKSMETNLEKTQSEANTNRFRLDRLRPDLDRLQRDLGDAAQELHTRRQDYAQLEEKLQEVEHEREAEAEKRRDITRAALQALQNADADLHTEQQRSEEHKTARFKLKGKVDHLQRALHRDQSD